MRKYLFILALLLVPTLGMAQGPVQVTSSHGPVEYEFVSDANFVPIDSKLPSLDIGDKIRTGEGAQLTMRLPDGSYIVVSENTRLEIEKFWGSDIRNLMKVMLGRVRFFIQRLGGRPNPYRIDTPTALIAVRGTTFEVIAGPLATEVRCLDGRVTVETVGMQDREVILDAGRKTMVIAGEYPMRPIQMDDMFGGSRVLRVVRTDGEEAPVLGTLRSLDRVARDNDRRNRQIDPLANPGGGIGLGQQVRRGKLTFPNK